MKILLTATNLCREPYPVYPLGLSVIAGALTEHGHDVKLIDLAPDHERWCEKLTAVYNEFQPQLIGLGFRNIDTVNSLNDTTGNLLAFPLEVTRFCKDRFPAPVVIGGSAFSLIPELLMEKSGADYGVCGEGEEAICRLAEVLESGEKPKNKLLHSEKEYQASAMYPHDVMEYYHKETHIIPIQSKRGCPFTCAYCGYPLLEGREIRARNPHDVIRDLRDLNTRYPDALLYFTDAVFNDTMGFFRELLNTMKKEAFSVPFGAFLTPFMLTEEDAILMSECGMLAGELGIDAGSDETLSALGKNFTFMECADACAMLQKHGIAVMTNLMFGGPGETYETIEKGIQNILSLKNVYSMIFKGIRIIPNTPLADIARAEGMLPEKWDASEEIYYYSPKIDQLKLDEMLHAGFDCNKFCIYPPQQRRRELQMIHRMGFLKMRALRKN